MRLARHRYDEEQLALARAANDQTAASDGGAAAASSTLVIAPQFFACNDVSYCDADDDDDRDDDDRGDDGRGDVGDAAAAGTAVGDVNARLNKTSELYWKWNSGWMKVMSAATRTKSARTRSCTNHSPASSVHTGILG